MNYKKYLKFFGFIALFSIENFFLCVESSQDCENSIFRYNCDNTLKYPDYSLGSFDIDLAKKTINKSLQLFSDRKLAKEINKGLRLFEKDVLDKDNCGDVGCAAILENNCNDSLIPSPEDLEINKRKLSEINNFIQEKHQEKKDKNSSIYKLIRHFKIYRDICFVTNKFWYNDRDYELIEKQLNLLFSPDEQYAKDNIHEDINFLPHERIANCKIDMMKDILDNDINIQSEKLKHNIYEILQDISSFCRNYSIKEKGMINSIDKILFTLKIILRTYPLEKETNSTLQKLISLFCDIKENHRHFNAKFDPHKCQLDVLKNNHNDDSIPTNIFDDYIIRLNQSLKEHEGEIKKIKDKIFLMNQLKQEKKYTQKDTRIPVSHSFRYQASSYDKYLEKVTLLVYYGSDMFIYSDEEKDIIQHFCLTSPFALPDKMYADLQLRICQAQKDGIDIQDQKKSIFLLYQLWEDIYPFLFFYNKYFLYGDYLTAKDCYQVINFFKKIFIHIDDLVKILHAQIISYQESEKKIEDVEKLTEKDKQLQLHSNNS